GIRHHPKEYSVKHETDKAIEFLRNRDGQRKKDAPFFLTLAYNPPHSPYESLDDCMEQDYDIYKNMSYKELYVRDNADTTLSKADAARYYFANVTGVDREFGRLLDELKALGLDRNTIVVFTSDHGETMCSQGTLDPKNSIYTESFNVPFIIRYPGRLRPRVDSVLLASVDIYPTLLSLAGLGAKIPESAEGRDLSPVLLENGARCDVPQAVLYLRNVNGEIDADGLVRGFFPVARGVKTDRYTMEITITRAGALSRVLIFDDLKDPYQKNNLDWRSNPELFKDLCSVLAAKLEEADDIWHREARLEGLFPKQFGK
ncbi:MAG: sulfatase-like hydrolase/transferase, partial [Candidatus Cryptobacteroides sp.]